MPTCRNGMGPLVANGLLYLNVGGKEIGVAAFDAANGKKPATHRRF